MATKNNENINALKKEKKATPSSSSSSSSTTSHPTRRPAAAASSPKPANANVKAVVDSTSKPSSRSGLGSARSSVPNYLKPTVSSRTNTDPSSTSTSTTTLRYVRKSTLLHDDTVTAETRRQSITAAPPNRRRSLDVPPSASSHSFKSLISPDSERPTSANTGSTARERTTIRSMSFKPRPNQNHLSSSSKPEAGNLERNSKSFKPSVKSSYNPSSPTPTSNLKRTASLTPRKTPPKDRMSLPQNLISDIDVTQILDIQGSTQEDSNLIHIDTANLESTSKNEEPVFYAPRTGIEELNDATTDHGGVNNKEKGEVNPSSDGKTNIISLKVSAEESETQTLKVEKPDHHESNELLSEEKEKQEEECKKIDEQQENDDTEKESQKISGDDGNAADLIVDEKKEEEEGISREINKSLGEGETVPAEENVCEQEAKAEQKRGAVAGKKESPAAYNDVIEEAKNKLLAKNTSKVKALAGAFETVIDYESASNSKSSIYHHHT